MKIQGMPADDGCVSSSHCMELHASMRRCEPSPPSSVSMRSTCVDGHMLQAAWLASTSSVTAEARSGMADERKNITSRQASPSAAGCSGRSAVPPAPRAADKV